MSRRSPFVWILLCLALAAATGCTPQQPFYLGDDGDLSHYKGIATELEVPDIDVHPLDEVMQSSAPLTLGNPQAAEIWDLSLEEAMQTALANSKVLRTLGGAAFPSDVLTRTGSPSSLSVPTVYDPALQESNPRFGTEAALSAFDAQFSTSMFWEKIDRPLNRVSSVIFASVENHDLGTFQSQLSKTNATGGTTGIGYNVAYDNDKASPVGGGFGRRWQSDWNVDVTAEFRQPLFQGAGVQFNRIAGPGAIPGYNNGVIIARIENDIALTDFEAAVRNMASDVEVAYWRLYLSYRELDAVVAGRDAALQTWRRIYNLQKEGARGGEAAEEAQAREQYWLFVAQVERSLSDVFANEAQLRYMLGLAVADGRQIRPADEPTPAKVSFDWRETMCEAMARNVDLRRQKWRVKEREMELITAKNFLLPRLDAVGQYRWRGLGNDYWHADRTGIPFDQAMENLTSGDYQDWQFGFEFSLPIGFRKQLAGVRYAQLNIAREKSLLREQELEVSHQLAASIRDLERNIKLIRTNYEYYVAARHEVAAIQAAYETGTITLNVLLDAQRRAAEAEVAYYRSLVDYNLAILGVHFRKGSLLEYNGIWLAEGPWVGKAYFDAKRRAQARDAGLYLNYGFTRPKVLSRGPYMQHAQPSMPFEQLEQIESTQAQPEEILVPAPETLPQIELYESSRSARPTATGPTLSQTESTATRGDGSEQPAPMPAVAAVRNSGEVQLASHAVQAGPSIERAEANPTVEAAAGQWKSVRPTSTQPQTTKTNWHESHAYSTSGQGSGAASGWKRM
ncbi:MAG: TolC family protein [Pirellulales bacterium]|nr:TolC family protein [Pirellulales bacterium]